jgi:6-phosphogluconolactonase
MAGTTVLFVSLTGDEAIKLFDLDTDSGALSLRATSSAHGPTGPLFLHPAKDKLLLAHVGSSTLASLGLDRDSGELTLINKVDTGFGTPAHLVTDRAGRFLLTAFYGGGGLTVHRLGADGSIGELVQRIDTGIKAHCIQLDPSERFVFVPHVCPNNKTSQFRFDGESGQLTPNEPAEVVPPDYNTGPRHLTFSNDGDTVYIVNEQGNTVTAHRFDEESGTLTRFQHLDTLPGGVDRSGHTAHIEMHPNSRWVYASNRGHDSIVGFEVDSDGSLSPFGHFPVPSSPRSFNAEPGGRFLYCAGESAGRLVTFRVDQGSGALAKVDELEVGKSPFWVMVAQL